MNLIDQAKDNVDEEELVYMQKEDKCFEEEEKVEKVAKEIVRLVFEKIDIIHKDGKDCVDNDLHSWEEAFLLTTQEIDKLKKDVMGK